MKQKVMDTTSEKNLHILMLPWLAHGHASPFLELAKKLSDRNLQVSFCSTPIILNTMKKKLNKKHSLKINFIELHLLETTELPPHYHTTTGLPPHLMPTLKQAFMNSCQNLCKIMDSIKPDIIIYDIMKPDTKESLFCDIPWVQFITTGCTVASYFTHAMNKGDGNYPIPGIRLHSVHDKQFKAILEQVSSERAKVKEKGERSSDMVLFNTFRELEGKFIDYLQILSEKKTLPVGPLVQDFVPEDNEIIDWLNDKQKTSTVFVSFGSEYFLTHDERMEVAYGLELSGVHFIWVVRFSKGEEISLEDALPNGFLERTNGLGLIVLDWAPQAQILAHPSTGGFLSHCGWNSILESTKYGVPIIAMPMHLDQPLNGSLLEDVGMGLGVKRKEDGKLDRIDISEVIRKVVKGDDGEEIRKKAKEISEEIRVRGEAEIDGLVPEFVNLCKRNDILLIYSKFF